MGKKLDFASVMKLALSYSQSRKARRGESLQNHFAHLLDDQEIPYTPQCPTEPGEIPDFIVPGEVEYHNPRFPDSRLRMVGCKTKVRERHRQWLQEARRVAIKYGLCVDDALSDEVVLQYRDQLRFFMPKNVATAYRGRSVEPLIGSVQDLLGALRDATSS